MKLLMFISIVIATVFQITASGMLIGGFSPVEDVNSQDFQRIVTFATAKITDRSNAAYLMKPIEILNAEKQVVAGMKYKFTMRIGATECKKNRSNNVELSDCKLQKCGRVEKCDVIVWDKPWENFTKVLEQSCKKEPKSC